MKHFLSLIIICIFFLFAVASKVNKIHGGAFNTNIAPEPGSRTYLELLDGTRIPGSKITYQSGIILKDQVTIDGRKFKMKETRGYMSQGIYFGRYGGSYIKRIIHGKVNVYHREEWVQDTDSRGRVSQRLSSFHYYQRGDYGEMLPLSGQKDIKRAVADCPEAVKMADLSNGKMRRAIRKDYNYLNSIFELYNNECKLSAIDQ
jgi:hypothetical protein